MLDFCTTEQPPDYSGTICGVSDVPGTVDPITFAEGCRRTTGCASSAEIGRAVSLIGPEPFHNGYLSCQPEQGELQCTCTMTNEGFYGEPYPDHAVLAACEESPLDCTP